MNRRGFSLMEMVLVMVIIGLVGMVATPRIRDAIQKQNVRSARVALGTQVAKARAVAVHRGCRAVVHFTSGTNGTARVTACKVNGAGIDTLGPVARIASQFSVTLTPTRDSVQFDLRGLSMDNLATTIRVAGGGILDSVMVNSLGKVTR